MNGSSSMPKIEAEATSHLPVRVTSENEPSSDESKSITRMTAPSFFEGGLPSMVPLPTAVPLLPNYAVLEMQLEKYSHASVNYYDELLRVIDEMKRDVRPLMIGNKAAMDRIRRGIMQARILMTGISTGLSKAEERNERREQSKASNTQLPSQGSEVAQKCDGPCCQRIQSAQPVTNNLAGTSIKYDLSNSAFHPLSIKTYFVLHDIRINKRTNKPEIYKPSKPNEDLLPLWDQDVPMLIRAPPYYHLFNDTDREEGRAHQ